MLIDPYLLVLLKTALIMGGITLLMLLIIVMIRLKYSWSEKSYHKKATHLENLFLNYLEGEIDLATVSESFKKLNDHRKAWRLLSPYIDTLEGNDFDKIKALCHETGLTDHYRKQLHSRLLKKKIYAARVLGSLKCSQSARQMIQMLSSRNPLVVQTAAQALAKSGILNAFAPTARALLANTNFTYEGAVAVLTEFGPSICKPITDMLETEMPWRSKTLNQTPPGRKTRRKKETPVGLNIYKLVLIDLLAYYRYRKALPLFVRLADTEDRETLVHILKAFINLEIFPQELSISSYLNHQYWVIRSFAAQAFRYAPERYNLELIDQLLDDQYYWVRFHAAQTLLKTGETGINILQKKISESRGVGADISRFILELEGVPR